MFVALCFVSVAVITGDETSSNTTGNRAVPWVLKRWGPKQFMRQKVQKNGIKSLLSFKRGGAYFYPECILLGQQ